MTIGLSWIKKTIESVFFSEDQEVNYPLFSSQLNLIPTTKWIRLRDLGPNATGAENNDVIQRQPTPKM